MARVLLADDDAAMRDLVCRSLSAEGHAVAVAHDGQEALDLAHSAAEPFDILVTDVQMPGISGYEATQALRLHYSALQLPVIALTAAALLSERQRAAEVGMNDFLTKPVDPQRLRAALLRVLHAAAAETQMH